ncbi:MAG: YraN family protein [Candidatus Omnitrophota bacterium]|nr:YraN family protein [Candidatus Omnitrophota bacterium]
MGREKKIVGAIGEKVAIKFLKDKGYKILETNYRTTFGELDAIANKDGLMIFIEIKTRASSSLGPPYLAVTALKIRHIIKNALYYLKLRGRVFCDWRIDVVSVKLGPDNKIESIELIENAVCDNY